MSSLSQKKKQEPMYFTSYFATAEWLFSVHRFLDQRIDQSVYTISFQAVDRFHEVVSDLSQTLNSLHDGYFFLLKAEIRTCLS